MKSEWLWDSRYNERQAGRILKNPKDPRFPLIAEKLISRISPAKKAFEFIDKETFCRNWMKIKKRMRRDSWLQDKVLFWQTVYENILADFKAKGIKVREELRPVTNVIQKSISQQIKEHRLKENIAQKDMARKMGVVQQYVSKLETGRENYSVQTLQQIARALNKKLVIKFQ